MITAEDLVFELNDVGENKNFKLATVTGLFANDTAKVQFDGEDTPSEKQYAYLASYTPKTLDRVFLAVTGGTYVILGKVNYNVSPEAVEALDRYLFDQKLVTMTKGLTVTGATTLNNALTVSGYSSLNGGASITGNLSVAGLTTNALNVTGSTSLNGLEVSGAVGFASTPNFNAGLYSNGSFYAVLSNAKVTGQLLHTGSYIGFFGRGATSKRVIGKLTGTATTQGNFNAINVIVGALQEYGLF